MRIETTDGVALAKRILYLAWKASKCLGMGLLQDKPNASEEEVWQNCLTSGDYVGTRWQKDGELYADYIFGRMMKLGFNYDEKSVSLPFDESEGYNKPRGDYQSWCVRYPTYKSLFDAAAKSLEEVHLEL